MKRTFKITIELSASVIEHIIGRVRALSDGDAKIEVVEIVAVDKPEAGVVS
jgi:hypothetical protein